MMRDTFGRRFRELDTAQNSLRFHDVGGGRLSSAGRSRNGEWRGWATSVQNLLRAVFGERSPHYANFLSQYEQCGGLESSVRTLFNIFQSAKQDFEGGYVFDVELRVSGEIFADFVTAARHSLNNGQKDVAAVLACAALEDALKRYATINQLAVDGKTMSEVINALKAAQLVGGAQKSLLDAMPRIRNMAMHGEWAKLTEPDVGSVLGFVEQFLLSKYSE